MYILKHPREPYWCSSVKGGEKNWFHLLEKTNLFFPASFSTFLKQDCVSNDPETFSCLLQTYELACAKASQIARQKRFFGLTTE
jgi:hypothetical protein